MQKDFKKIKRDYQNRPNSASKEDISERRKITGKTNAQIDQMLNNLNQHNGISKSELEFLSNGSEERYKTNEKLGKLGEKDPNN